MKKLAVLGDFLEPHHHAQIDSTAARCGFAADYYPDGHVPAELAGQYEVLYGMPDRAALRTFTSLKWFCGNFAGVDAYLDDALYPSPDVILTNSSGAYGVTIAEHLIMVTLMLLRHASAYVLEAAAHRWGPVLPMRSIMGSTITVVGTGDIGTEFARRAKAMGAKSIRGVRRTMKPADPAFDSVHTHDQLESLLLVRWGHHYNQGVHALNSIKFALDHGRGDLEWVSSKLDECALLLAQVDEGRCEMAGELASLEGRAIVGGA